MSHILTKWQYSRRVNQSKSSKEPYHLCLCGIQNNEISAVPEVMYGTNIDHRRIHS